MHHWDVTLRPLEIIVPLLVTMGTLELQLHIPVDRTEHFQQQVVMKSVVPSVTLYCLKKHCIFKNCTKSIFFIITSYEIRYEMFI